MLASTSRHRLRDSRGKYNRYSDADSACRCAFCLQQFRLLAKAEHRILALHSLHSTKEELTNLFLKSLKDIHEAIGVSIWSKADGVLKSLYALDWPEGLAPQNSLPIAFPYGTYTVLTAPLPYAGFGDSSVVASVVPRKTKLFTKQRLLDSMAKHMNIALLHLDVDSYYMKRTASLELLREIARQFATNVHLDDLFKSIYEATSKVISTDVFFVALYEEDTQEVNMAYVFEAGLQLAPFSFPLNDGPTSQVIKSNAALLSLIDSSRIPGGLLFGNTTKTSETSMFAPITLHNQVLGALSVQSYSPAAYTEEDLLLLSAIANQAAIAIHNAQLYEHVLKLATTDSLTGLMNKRAFTEALNERLAVAAESDSKLALIMIDSDSLKFINDTYGHCAGDDHLRNVARVLRSCVREEDLICRYGGDEFVLLLADTDIVVAATVAERIVERVSASIQLVADVAIHVTVSAGVAEFSADTASASRIIMAADNNLRAAKRAGKNRVNTIGCN